jgi:hypothetical protein
MLAVLLFLLAVIACGHSEAACTISDTGLWMPDIVADSDGGHQNHTIDLILGGVYSRCDDLVSVSVTYVIGTTATSGYAEWVDLVTLPDITHDFESDIEAIGDTTLAISSGDSDYKGGTVFTEEGGQHLQPLYSFSSPGGTEVFVHVHAVYKR